MDKLLYEKFAQGLQGQPIPQFPGAHMPQAPPWIPPHPPLAGNFSQNAAPSMPPVQGPSQHGSLPTTDSMEMPWKRAQAPMMPSTPQGLGAPPGFNEHLMNRYSNAFQEKYDALKKQMLSKYGSPDIKGSAGYSQGKYFKTITTQQQGESPYTRHEPSSDLEQHINAMAHHAAMLQVLGDMHELNVAAPPGSSLRSGTFGESLKGTPPASAQKVEKRSTPPSSGKLSHVASDAMQESMRSKKKSR